MVKTARDLALVLRVIGVVDLLALAAVVVPGRWLALAHAWLGLGEMPAAPIVGYLARSASVLYALHGGLILFISFDVPRYWPLITFLGACAFAHGAVLVAVDLAEGMPVWWAWVEGLGYLALGTLVLGLQRMASGTPADTNAEDR
jgi:hypothetical protein